MKLEWRKLTSNRLRRLRREVLLRRHKAASKQSRSSQSPTSQRSVWNWLRLKGRKVKFCPPLSPNIHHTTWTKVLVLTNSGGAGSRTTRWLFQELAAARLCKGGDTVSKKLIGSFYSPNRTKRWKENGQKIKLGSPLLGRKPTYVPITDLLELFRAVNAFSLPTFARGAALSRTSLLAFPAFEKKTRLA